MLALTFERNTFSFLWELSRLHSVFWQIPVLADLPVGENLLDHLFIDIPFLVDGKIAITPDEISSWKSNFDYNVLGKGAFLLLHFETKY